MMSIRSFLNNQQSIATILAIIVLAGAIYAIIVFVGGSNDVPERVYFYDISNEQLVPVSNTEMPPIGLTSGGMNGVRARVYSCDGGEERILWLEKYRMVEVNGRMQRVGRFPLVRSVEGSDDRWHEFESKEGRRVRLDAKEDFGCAPSDLQEVFP